VRGGFIILLDLFAKKFTITNGLSFMPILHFLLVLLVVAVWGVNFVAIKVGLEEIPPLFLVSARFFLTCFPAIFFIKKPAAPFKMVIWYGLIMFDLPFALLFLGMHAGITPGLASLLLQLQVFFTILLAVLFMKERLHPWEIVGALVSFSGIAFVAMNLGGDTTLSGFLLAIAAAAFWGAGNIVSKKIGKVNMVSLVVWGSLIAWPPLLLASLAVEGDKVLYALPHVTGSSISALFFITYFATLFAFGAWSWLIHHHPLRMIAPFTLLVPVFGILSSVLLLNEPLQMWKLLAAILVIIGLGINVFGPQLHPRKK
jgi:O-acetylserine/cysteine efflux transporter